MRRIVGLDIARSFAMLTALSTHVLTQTGAPFSIALNLLLRTSTPTFMILFGAMIALVHGPKLEKQGFSASLRASYTRSVQCYLLFLLNVLALALAQSYSFSYTALCALMLGASPYAAILKYYTIMFLLLPLLVVAVKQFSLRLCMMFACLYEFLYPLLKAFPPMPELAGQPVLERVVSLVAGLGITNEVAGPSVLHSFTLVFAGIYLGRWIKGERDKPSPELAKATLARLVAILGVLAALAAIWPGPGSVDLASLAGMELRNLNHPAYIFITGGVALLTILAFVRISWRKNVPEWLLLLGRRSLFAFGFGNVIIVLWPRALSDDIGTLPSASVLLLCVIATVAVYDAARRDSALIPGPMKTAIDRLVAAGDRMTGKAGALLSMPLVIASQRIRAADAPLR